MARTDNDTWDLASSVGATATMVAAARAIASREPDALIQDPYAASLVREVGIDFFTKLVDGVVPPDAVGDGSTARTMTDVMAVRTRFFDDFFLGSEGVPQAVILASGLDSRAYRLPWPSGTVVYEIDQPRVIEAKSAAMTRIGASATCDRRAVGIDLREDWPDALRHSGFDPAQPTAWSAEGLLVYLPPEAQDRLFDDITANSAPGSRLATEYHPDGGAAIAARAAAMNDVWRDHGFDLDMGELFYSGERTPVIDSLTAHGWQVSARSRAEVFAHYGRRFEITGDLAPMSGSLAVIATKS